MGLVSPKTESGGDSEESGGITRLRVGVPVRGGQLAVKGGVRLQVKPELGWLSEAAGRARHKLGLVERGVLEDVKSLKREEAGWDNE